MTLKVRRGLARTTAVAMLTGGLILTGSLATAIFGLILMAGGYSLNNMLAEAKQKRESYKIIYK
ncbi:MAG: hypothetical protein WCW02_04320 [Candidatus Buchananbacteria bacterium]